MKFVSVEGNNLITSVFLCFQIVKKKKSKEEKEIKRKVKRRKRRGPSGPRYEYCTNIRTSISRFVYYTSYGRRGCTHTAEKEEEKEVDVGRRRRRHRASVVAAKIEGGFGRKLSSKISISVQKFFSKDY